MPSEVSQLKEAKNHMISSDVGYIVVTKGKGGVVKGVKYMVTEGVLTVARKHMMQYTNNMLYYGIYT